MSQESGASKKVWIPSVPLPLLGWRVDICNECRRKFRGFGRRHRYEIHYRREHQRGKDSQTLMEVSREEARRIYAEVNADLTETRPEATRV